MTSIFKNIAKSIDLFLITKRLLGNGGKVKKREVALLYNKKPKRKNVKKRLFIVIARNVSGCEAKPKQTRSEIPHLRSEEAPQSQKQA